MKKLAAVLALAAFAAACSPTSTTAPSATKTKTNHVSDSRYILISGESPFPGCTDVGGGWQSCPGNIVPQ
jgi:hypothetical protein